MGQTCCRGSPLSMGFLRVEDHQNLGPFNFLDDEPYLVTVRSEVEKVNGYITGRKTPIVHHAFILFSYRQLFTACATDVAEREE
mmetsp:Transcript_40052/g.64224  ORF Transcript_40052/g.64224 Transcript_40052/m.64224 type:complete len:84 (-) Transcript_40052:573-824(-)